MQDFALDIVGKLAADHVIGRAFAGAKIRHARHARNFWAARSTAFCTASAGICWSSSRLQVASVMVRFSHSQHTLF